MVYQAFRTRYALAGTHVSRTQNAFIIDFPSFRVPCGPVRSSFAAAFEDVRCFRELGFVAAVRAVNPIVSY